MKRTLRALAVLLVLSGLSPQAWGFKISPCLRVLVYQEGQLGQQAIRTFNPCRFIGAQYVSAVHEDVTLATLRESFGEPAMATVRFGAPWKYEYMVERPLRRNPGAPPHDPHALMFGVWWNDDPLMRTWGQGWDFTVGAKDLHGMLRPGRRFYIGGAHRCNNVPAAGHLFRQSHFGTLQHLHFMTGLPSDDSTPAARLAATTDGALRWMAFAYQVATGELPPEAPLTPELEQAAGLPSMADNHRVTDPRNVKIRTVFSRLGQNIEYRHELTPDVALGSMLHVIQDSFAPAHACRVEQEQVAAGIRQANLLDVENYAEQDTDVHATLDSYPPWLNRYFADGHHTYANDPIVVGAWLISAVDRRVPWPEVEAYLRSTAFARADAVGATGVAGVGKGTGSPAPCIGRPGGVASLLKPGRL